MAIPTKTDVETLDYAYLRSGAFVGVPSKTGVDTDTLDYAYLRSGAKIGNANDPAGGAAIKTWNGIAWDSIKTLNGTARASIKTHNGLAAQ